MVLLGQAALLLLPQLRLLGLLLAPNHALHRLPQRVDVQGVLVLLAILLVPLAAGKLGEVGKRLHQLVALRNGNVRVVNAGAGAAVHIEPPIAFEDRLVEECVLRAEERLPHQAVIGEGANVEDLPDKGENGIGKQLYL